MVAGSGGVRRAWKGQLYADDLAAGAASARGLQLLIDAVREHSRRWGWTLNVPKSHVVVFGGSAAWACTSRFCWGPHQLTRVPCERYLGIHLHESCTWDRQVQAAADKGRRALYA